MCNELVTRFHGAQAAKDALADFENRFRQGGIPDDIAEVIIESGGAGAGVAQVLKQAGLVALKGHRVLGGMRASLYNAMPEAGVQALVDFMRDFQVRHG